MKRIARNVALVLILIFVLSGLKISSFTCYAETEVKGKEYYMELAEDDPQEALRHAGDYKDQPWAQEVIERVAEEEPETALWFADCYEDQPYAQKIIETAAEKKPRAALACVYRYKDQPWALKVIEEAIEGMAENDIRKMPSKMFFEEVQNLLQQSRKPVVRAILAICEKHSYRWGYYTDYYGGFCFDFIGRRMCSILEEIVSKNMILEEAANIVDDEKKFFETLMRIKNKPNHLGKVAVEEELRDAALRIVRKIDDLHNEPDSVRFESVKDVNSQELYTLMVYGEEEIFTSSFNGLFDRLLGAMKTEKIDGDKLLGDLGYNRFRVFIRLCAGFNRLNEFLETMEKDLQKSLLRKFVRGIDKEKDSLEEAVVIADTFSVVEDKEILKVLQETIKEEYGRVKLEESKEGKILYGLLAGMFGKKAVINEAWIQEMAKKYQLPDLTKIPSRELFNPSGLNLQWYFFYNDEDGRYSFWNFLSQYRGKRDWRIEEKESFILIKSTRNGKKIEIYANKPEADKTGPEEIAKILEERNVQPVVVVHRGHSYHIQKTIGRVPSNAKIISLGSCGGCNNVSAVLGRASEAHIISTKRRGTMLVNDPLLKMLNDEILTGKDIYWPGFWQKAEKRLGSINDFKNYIPPHKNLGVLFLKAYRHLLESETLTFNVK